MYKIVLGILYTCFHILWAQTGLDIYTQYTNAYRMAWELDEVRYQGLPAQDWALQYLEKRLVLSKHWSLQQSYQKLYEFAQHEPMNLGHEPAMTWAKTMLLDHYRHYSGQNLKDSLVEFVFQNTWNTSEEKTWMLEFLCSPHPLVCKDEPLKVARDMYRLLEYPFFELPQVEMVHNRAPLGFIRNNTPFPIDKPEDINAPNNPDISHDTTQDPDLDATKDPDLDATKDPDLDATQDASMSKDTHKTQNAPNDMPIPLDLPESRRMPIIHATYPTKSVQEIVQQFIRERYRFSDSVDISSQYRFACEYAMDMQYGLGMISEEAESWAKVFITQHGCMNSQETLGQQYQQAYRWIEYEFYIKSQRTIETDYDMENLALEMLQKHGNFPNHTNIADNFRSAFMFAYTNNFLPILRNTGSIPGETLHDQAIAWAKDLIEKRGYLCINQDLTSQYYMAQELAYRNFPSPSNPLERMTLDEAREWAQNILLHDPLP